MCDVGAAFGQGVILRKFAGQKEGLVLGKLTHDTDLLQYLADSYAEEVHGYSANFLWKRHGDLAGSDDTCVINGILHNGVLFSQSLTSCGATYGRVMEFWGEKGVIRGDINSETIQIALCFQVLPTWCAESPGNQARVIFLHPSVCRESPRRPQLWLRGRV